MTKLIQVVYDGLDYPSTLKREISSLKEAGIQYKNAEKIIILGRTSVDIDKIDLQSENIQLIPLWKFLLGKKK